MNKKILIQPTFTVKNALKYLTKTAEKVLLVVDPEECLLGTLTDGDIRRYLLSGGKIEHTIEKVYNPKPIFLLEKDVEIAKELMLKNKIELIPIVDKNRKVKDYFTWTDIFTEKTCHEFISKSLNIPVVVMAGGKGTRLKPFTKILPKPLIPVGDKPIIDIIVNEFRMCGVEKFYLTLNYKGELIETYFNSYKKNFTIEFIREKDFLGTAGSLKLLENIIEDIFIVTNCDVIVKANYADVLSFHKEQGASITILSSIKHYKIPYGVIDFSNGGAVIKIIEKPEYVFTINTGVYVLNKDVLKYIPADSFFNMTDLIQCLLNDKQKVITYPVNEDEYIDIGQWEEYKKALEVFKNLWGF